MQIKSWLSKELLIDVISSIVACLIWLSAKYFLIQGISIDYLLDLILVGCTVAVFLTHNKSNRFFYYGFFFLFVSALSTAFRVDSLSYFASSLVLMCLLLGLINQIIFGYKDK